MENKVKVMILIYQINIADLYHSAVNLLNLIADDIT